MTRARLRLIATCALLGLGIGAVVGVVGAVVAGLIGGIAGLGVAVMGAVLAVLLAPRFMVRYVLPRQLRSMLRRMADAGEMPPPNARPVELPLAGRYAAATNARDWAVLGELVDHDLVLTHPATSRRYGRKHFLKSARVSTEAYPDLRMVVKEVVADPASPDVAWVRVLETGRPRVGAPLHASWWERWTLGADSLTVRELALGRAVQVD